MVWRPLYRGATGLAAPFISRLLDRRLACGKEDEARFSERMGIPSRDRPPGNLVWLHAASNGEAMSALPLVDRLLASPGIDTVLVTTGTVTSAKLMGDRLPEGAFHQFIPVDRPEWVRRFISHWRPDLAIWIESELWPNLIWEMRDTGKPLALVNGRVSRASFRKWRRLPGFAKDLFKGFSLILAQTEAEAERLSRLAGKEVFCLGNLKLSAPPLPVDEAALTALRGAVGDRHVWLAASTHPGEEAEIAAVHKALREDFPDLLTIIVPRHPTRGEGIAASLARQGLKPVRRSDGPLPGADTEIYLADTLGELGIFYSLAPIAFIGGSLPPHAVGGHNPVEAAQLDTAILFGADMANFESIAESFIEAGGAVEVADGPSLVPAVRRLLLAPEESSRLASAAAAAAQAESNVDERVITALGPLLPTSGDAS